MRGAMLMHLGKLKKPLVFLHEETKVQPTLPFPFQWEDPYRRRGNLWCHAKVVFLRIVTQVRFELGQHG